MTYYFLANPNSGAGRGARALEILLPYLEKNSIQYKLFTTKKAGDEPSLVREILSEKTSRDQLLVIGGDGTISLVMNELPTDEAISYIPTGSGNDFARSLKLSLDPIKAFEAARLRKTSEIFIMHYQSQKLSGYALNNIGIGLDATIVKATNDSKMKIALNKIKLGSLSYVLTALHVLVTKKAFGARIDTVKSDEAHKVFRTNRAFLLTFTKHPYFGGGVKISPEASNFNPDIHLVEYDKRRLLRTFSMIPKVLKGTHLKHPLFLHRVFSNFMIELEEEQLVQIDGEIYQLRAKDPLLITTEQRKMIY